MFGASERYTSTREAWSDALRLQLRVICALVLRETRSHFGEYRLGYLWAIIEPACHLLMYAFIFKIILIRNSPVGGSLLLFALTGFIPYFLYSKVAAYLMTAIPSNRPLLSLPVIKPLDVMVSRTILEATTYLVVGAIMLTVLYLRGDHGAIPYDPVMLAEAVIINVAFSFGAGLINGVIYAYFTNWPMFFAVIFGPLYFISGIFFLPDEIPQPLRSYSLYNPILQLVQWFRSGFYPNYDPDYFFPAYIIYWTIAVVAIGLCLLRVSRRKLLEPV